MNTQRCEYLFKINFVQMKMGLYSRHNKRVASQKLYLNSTYHFDEFQHRILIEEENTTDLLCRTVKFFTG